ncbi:MAG TPA: YhdP family protein [Accumulibacter sp.]|jgi:uncharacterized protein (TIGR02099 family)|nr:YhdP family protein [Accumulibacter sp.]
MRQEQFRPLFASCSRAVGAVIAHPFSRSFGRLLARAFWLLYFGFVLLVLALRYAVLPNIETYRPQIEEHLGRMLGLSVGIGRIETRWDGINPDLTLSDVRIADRQGQPVLAFNRVEGVLSWTSLPRLQLRLLVLRIDKPTLHLRRDADGRFFVAGIAMSQDGSNSDVADWVLVQKKIRIDDATVVWEDAKRQAPPLAFANVDFALDNDGRRHRFGLTAQPPESMASPIDLRGDFRGKDIERTESWNGQVFGQIDYADLAVWRTWLDYPITLPRGRGALRAWAGIAEGRLQELTTDFSLDDVHLQLAENLPPLDLDRMSGRLGVRFSPDGARVDGRGLELLTRESTATNDDAQHIHVGPTDFHVDWQNLKNSDAVRGSARASVLDLAPLRKLAAHLPLDAGSRKWLSDLAPRGRLADLRVNWQGNIEKLQKYALKSRFDELSINASGHFPGASSISGSIDADEHGGNINVLGRKASIELPAVFTESSIPFDTLRAEAKWKIAKEQLDVELSRVEFANPEAAGTAQGSYRLGGTGPGRIDLTANLVRADARAVWRYLPRVINADARQWVRNALKAGTASEAKLVLKGDLANFPFSDHKNGQFLVTVKAHDVTLDYGPGWPFITGIDADLRFEGTGMVVQASKGAIFGAKLSQTRAEIPDFDAPVSTLKVKGHAEGETAEFLKFIKQSPVAKQIDHFTDDMGAVGKGTLDIGMTIPLQEARLGESKVDGNYTFAANEVTVDASLPPLQQVNGGLRFSEKDLKLSDISAIFLGGSLRIGGGTQSGKLAIAASGRLGIDELRRRVEWPLLDHLSGGTTYRADVRVVKRNVELVLDSNLTGVGSTLAAPFAKNAADVLPLHLETVILPSTGKGAPTGMREQVTASLGNVANLQIIRRRQAENSVIERGAIAIGRPLRPMPERGIAIGVTTKTIDLDYWQSLLRPAGKDVAAAPGPRFPMAFDLKADEAIILGRSYGDVSLGIWGAAPQWRGGVQSKDAIGTFQWDGAGAGKLAAHFKKWRQPDKESKNATVEEALKELPALDVVIDDFAVGASRFGRLEVQAHNDGGVWRLTKVEIANPNGSLTGSGQWQFAGGKRMQLDFTLESSDAGKLLERLGHGGVVRGGVATLKGKIGWNGQPTMLDYGTLSGDMRLEASNGRFVKLDPGAGRLLGLISLQGLPRRFLLDFGDVFSEGFSFDNINGRMTVKSGLMRTDRLQIDGPSARVVMRGETDLKMETQRLNVTVQPELGGSAALGVAVINPLAGVATLLAHKILQNPLNKVFSFDYLVTGKWDDPKVERLSRANPGREDAAPPPTPTGGSDEPQP